MSSTKSRARHRKAAPAKSTMVRRATGGAMLGAGLTVGMLGAGGGLALSSADTCVGPLCFPTPEGNSSQATLLNTGPAAFIDAGQTGLAIGNALASPILDNPLTLVFTGGL